jgi:hypothetical protein
MPTRVGSGRRQLLGPFCERRIHFWAKLYLVADALKRFGTDRILEVHLPPHLVQGECGGERYTRFDAGQREPVPTYSLE